MIDYMVMEAVLMKVNKADDEAMKKHKAEAERKEWRSRRDHIPDNLGQ